MKRFIQVALCLPAVVFVGAVIACVFGYPMNDSQVAAMMMLGFTALICGASVVAVEVSL